MSRPIISTILIAIAILVFFSFVDPKYKEIKELKNEDSQFDEALVRSRELQEVRNDLLSKYNTFSSEDTDRINKLLPDNVDNVRLILDLDGIASEYGILIKELAIDDGKGDENSENGKAKSVQFAGNTLGEIGLSFRVQTSYNLFKQFMKDLEESLRIVDIQSLSISPNNENREFLDFKVNIKTYWLK